MKPNNNFAAIDYSDLKDLRKSTGNFNLIIIPVILMVAAVIYGLISGNTNIITLAILIGGGFITLLFLYFHINDETTARAKNEILERFAVTNGFKYTSVQFPTNSDSGSLFKLKNVFHASKSNVFTGTINGLPFDMYIYSYVIDNTPYNTRIFEITLPRFMPHIIINSLIESDKYSLSTLPISFDVSQRIELEGNFSKYFALYAPDQYGVTALSILAPDAMEVVMQHASKCDIEIIDNKLYFYWSDTGHSPIIMQDKFSTVNEFLRKVSDKLVSSDIFGQESQKQQHINSSALLYRQRWQFTPFQQMLVLSIIIYLVVYQFIPGLSIYLLMPIIFIAGLLLALIRQLRQKHLRKKFENEKYINS